MYGPAQAAVAKAVSDCVFEGILPKEASEDLFIIVSVFLEWDAKDKKKIYDYNYLATKSAIERAVTGKPAIEEILSRKDEAKHPLPEYRLPWVADGPGLMKSRTVCLVHLYPHKTHNELHTRPQRKWAVDRAFNVKHSFLISGCILSIMEL